MDAIDRMIVDALQGGIDVVERPFAPLARLLGMTEDDLVERVGRLLDAGVLTRFGPMYDAEALGGLFTLAALSVPEADFERVAGLVNAHPEVAHNYAREHEYNMWFVIAAEKPGDVARVIAEIERETGCEVLDLPRLEEYGLQLRLEAR
ncbi:MAG: AsnC family transcriptional regulator [Burkholderiales bacterium]|nr:AsnC family transcriptional regulator [Burkholderiales bacterium]